MTDYSVIILAGGKSSRMGQKKANLTLNQKSFVEIIRDKFLALGVDDIILSGYEIDCENTRYVPDVFENMGPLAGIHAGLSKARNRKVFVIAEDSPLIPIDFLRKLAETHEKKTENITLAKCGGRLQPLVGIYDRELYSTCEKLLSDISQSEKTLRKNRRPIMSLIDVTGCNKVEFEGDELLLRGCNTPEEYEKICDLNNM